LVSAITEKGKEDAAPSLPPCCRHGFSDLHPLGWLCRLAPWTGSSPSWTQVQVDLSSWAGNDVLVRWHAGEDVSIGFTGWHVDSVTFGNVEQQAAQLRKARSSEKPEPRQDRQ
jgi:hypothetical protein